MSEHPHLIRSRYVFDGRVFKVRVDTVLDEGKERRLDIVEHPGSFAIAALPAPDRLVLVRQYRHAVGRELWEIPAGTAHEDEPCESGARRELREETGFTVDSMELLCALYPTPGFLSERLHLYAARGLHPGEQQLDEDERIELGEFSFGQAWSMQASGEIADMKTVLALLWLSAK